MTREEIISDVLCDLYDIQKVVSHRFRRASLTYKDNEGIETTINEAVTQWLPYLTIQNVFVTTPEESPNSVMVQIEFTVDLDDPNSVEVLTLNFNSGI